MTTLRPHVHHDHVHPEWGVEQVGWLGQSGKVYALDDEAGLKTEPGGYGPLYQARDESCGHTQVVVSCLPDVVPDFGQ